MNPPIGSIAQTKLRLTIWLVLISVATLSPWAAQPQTAPATPVFLLEIPGLGVTPTDRADLAVPSVNAPELVIHLLSPTADSIDYGQIYPYVNGEAAATVSQVTANQRGKIIRVPLRARSEIRLVPGRNSIEIRAENRRGRTFYASFVVRTLTENRNQELAYDTIAGNDPRQQVPPELVLLEPERAVELRGQRASRIRFAGVATAANSVSTVTINGEVVPLKRGTQVGARALGIAHEQNRAVFDSIIPVSPSMTEIVVEAVDSTGNKTRLTVPVTTTEPQPPSTFQGKKYALIFGISRFRTRDERRPNLQFADVDAQSVYQFLLSPAGGSFSPDNMRILTNEQATLGQIKDALRTFALKPGPDDLMLVFLSSHGGPDPFAQQNLYFLAHDTDLDRMAETGLAMKELQLMLQQNVRAKRLILLVDTCHSAGLTESPREMARGLRNNLVNLYSERLLYAEEGRAVITSSDVNETSLEGPKWGGGHGVFTYWLLEGLQGKADTNADHLVTVGELFRFVRQRVRFDTQFQQNPRILASTNENLAIAAVPPRTAR